MLNLYEGMYIVDPALSEQEVESLTERLKSEIVARGGEILDVQHLGKKRLAYAIHGKRDGFYFLLYFRLAPERLSELKAGYRLMDSILRFLILRKREREVELSREQTSVGGRPDEPEREDLTDEGFGEFEPQEVDEPDATSAGAEEEE
jgi:small subunit ribosomal protein S6